MKLGAIILALLGASAVAYCLLVPKNTFIIFRHTQRVFPF
jgi:hypothetical protein